MISVKITCTTAPAMPEVQTVKSEREALNRLIRYAKREDTLKVEVSENGRDIFKFERFPDFRR